MTASVPLERSAKTAVVLMAAAQTTSAYPLSRVTTVSVRISATCLEPAASTHSASLLPIGQCVPVREGSSVIQRLSVGKYQ